MEGFNALSKRNSDEKLLYKALEVSEWELYKPWKPWTFNSDTLISTAVFSVGLAWVLVARSQYSQFDVVYFAAASYELMFNSNATEIELWASLRQPDGSKIVCVGNIDGRGFIDQEASRHWSLRVRGANLTWDDADRKDLYLQFQFYRGLQ